MTSVRWTRLSERGGIRVTGSERVRWLDGMVSQDVASMSPGSVAPALALTHQGRIVGDPWLWVFDDHVWMDLASAAIEPVQSHLDRLIIADDVTLTAEGSESARFTLEGESAASAACEVLGAAADAELCTVDFEGEALVIACHGLLSPEGVQLRIAASHAEALEARLSTAAGLVAESPEAFEQRRISTGVPWYGRELDASVLPAEARLDAAISTTKGCYAGQEVVARMRSRGRVSSLLVRLAFEGQHAPAPGTHILVGGKKVGEITSATDHPSEGAIGMGFVKTAHAVDDASVLCGDVAAKLRVPVGDETERAAAEQ